MQTFSKLAIFFTAVTAFEYAVTDTAFARVSTHTASVDVIVLIANDGAATVKDSVVYEVTSGEMTKMSFQNTALSNPVFQNMFVQYPPTPNEPEKVEPLTLEKISNTQWKFVANPKVPVGRSVWSFEYTGNMIRDGYIGTTYSPDHGNLYYFHWNPVKWQDALQYRRVLIVLPIEVSGKELSEEEFIRFAGYSPKDGMNSGSDHAMILTEKDLNQRNQINYIGYQYDEDTYFLGINIYQPNVYPQEELNIEFYIRPEALTTQFPTYEEVAIKLVPLKKRSWGYILLILGSIGIACCCGNFIYKRGKQKEIQIKESLDSENQMLEDIWEAPELQVGSYEQKGKIVKDLPPIEVGLFLGLSIEQTIGMFAQALADEGKLVIKSLEPLTAFKSALGTLTPQEEAFTNIFDETGAIDKAKLNTFVENTITDLEERIWDCDRAQTRRYYLEMLYENPDETDPTKLKLKIIPDRTISTSHDDDDDYYYRNRIFWHYCYGYTTGLYAYHLGLPELFSRSYNNFIDVKGADFKACHSACHDACHSACHDACHSACHDACHSACHSACVSGGAE